MARTPLGHKDKTYGGQQGSAGYQGNTGMTLGGSLGGAGAAIGGLAAGALTGGLVTGVAAIGSLIGLVGDMIASGSGSKKHVAPEMKPTMAPRDAQLGNTQMSVSSAKDPGSAPISGGQAGEVRLKAAQNLGRRFG